MRLGGGVGFTLAVGIVSIYLTTLKILDRLDYDR